MQIDTIRVTLDYEDAQPPHAGLILSEMWLKPLGLTITKAAEQLNVSRKTLSELVNARAGVTPEMALRLEIAFGKSADSWLGHQSAYDLWKIQARRKTLGVSKFVNLAVA